METALNNRFPPATPALLAHRLIVRGLPIAVLLLGQAAFAQTEPLLPPPPPATQPIDRPVPPEAKDKKKKKKIQVSGFLTVWYKVRIDQDAVEGTEPDLFRLGKSRIRVSGWLTDQVGYVLEADPRSPTIIGVMRDAYIRLKLIPKHQIRLGQQKTQFGYENPESSTRLYTITRSELSESLGRGVTLRDIGIGVIGRWPLGARWRLEDALTLVNGAGLGVQADPTQGKNLWGRVGVRYDDDDAELMVRLGVSGGIGDQREVDPGPPETLGPRWAFRRIGADVEVDWTWVFVASEWAYSWDEIPAGSGVEEISTAWYVLVAGKTPWHVGPVVRYDTFDAEDYQRLTAGVYWGNPDDRFRVIAHYEAWEDGEGRHDDRVMIQSQVVF